jgi:hypothetical protein
MTYLHRMGMLLFACIPIILASCKTTVPSFVNWNAVFKEGMDSLERERIIQSVKSNLSAVRWNNKPSGDSLSLYVSNYLDTILPDRVKYRLRKVEHNYCSCEDTLLWTVRADLVFDHSGTTPVPPPPKNPSTTVQGPFDALDYNEQVNSGTEDEPIDNSSKVDYTAGYIFKDGAVIGVLDTGLDPDLFELNLRNNMMADGSRNLMIGANPDNYMDDHPARHGSSVAALTMNSFYATSGNASLPKLIALKALDKDGKGSLFEFCCALSYSIDKKVTLINASLGFYGDSNSVLNYYLRKTTAAGIPVVTAAGNSRSEKGIEICEDQRNPQNRLNSSHQFFPACMAEQENMLILSVTGMKTPGAPCYYQNYSDQYISLGVQNQTSETNCCSYRLPFIRGTNVISGSSFATPVAAGRLTFKIAEVNPIPSIPTYLNLLGAVPAPTLPPGNVTRNNLFISY